MGLVAMSLQIPVQKDIGEYEQKIVGKMSLRTLVCVAGGFASAIGVAAFCYFVMGIQVANATFPVMCAAMPFWLAGFWRPFGMKAEQFLPLFIEQHANDQRLLYSSSPNPELARLVPGKQKDRSWKRKGAENR